MVEVLLLLLAYALTLDWLLKNDEVAVPVMRQGVLRLLAESRRGGRGAVGRQHRPARGVGGRL
jgi:hypothetical protein